MLKTACILSERSPDDGLRVSVMSRHTLNDGKTPDTRIVEQVSYDTHCRELAPPPKLVGSYYRWEITFEKYEEQYREYLQSREIQPVLESLVKLALVVNVTLLCIEDTPEKCHRRILAEACAKTSDLLSVSIS